MSEVWTFARVFQRMYERSKSGILEVMGPDGEARLHLQAGKVVNLETSDAGNWRLGDFLVESETVASNELARLVLKSEKSGKPLEQLLVDKGLVTADILKRFVELHVRETIFPLFRKTGITCRFEELEPTANPWMSPIPAPYFLKNAGRRAELWPRLNKRIPHDEVVFDKVDAYIKTVLGETSSIIFTEEEGEKKPQQDTGDHIGGNERIVYYYVNGKKTVRQLSYASCLGEFETYIALVKLFDKGFIEVREQRGKGEKLKKKRTVLPAILRTGAWGISLSVVVGLAILRPGALQAPEGFVRVMPPQLERSLIVRRKADIRAALEASYLRSGAPHLYPDEPGLLVKDSLLGESELQEDVVIDYEAQAEPPPSYRLGVDSTRAKSPFRAWLDAVSSTTAKEEE